MGLRFRVYGSGFGVIGFPCEHSRQMRVYEHRGALLGGCSIWGIKEATPILGNTHILRRVPFFGVGCLLKGAWSQKKGAKPLGGGG